MTSGGGETRRFYDDLAEDYHDIYADWSASIRRQAGALDALIGRYLGAGPFRILDAACGIGTQALGLAALGHEVRGSDISPASLERARREAAARDLTLPVCVDDVRTLRRSGNEFDAVIACDNALPHLLDDSELEAAVGAMAAAARRGGVVLASLRDYAEALRTRPAFDGPYVWGDTGERHLTLQLWSWIDDERYDLLHVMGREHGSEWTFRTGRATYRALRTQALADIFTRVGLERVQVLLPASTGYFQPIVIGIAGSE